ncbi:MAG: hypothetical protein QMD07_01875 [Thermodesulfovibrionales bacterium]|nr:hypothetical protein [Thermodesulfovibrionales bacterium]
MKVRTLHKGLILALIFCLIAGFAVAQEMVKGKVVKPIDEEADFADPYKYNEGKKNLTFDGIEFAATEPRSGNLWGSYTKLDFPMDKVFGKTEKATGNGKCLTCHEGIEEISANHKFACTKCHGGDANAADMKAAHSNMMSNPSDLTVAQKVCGECHKDHVGHVSSSLMATAAGEINSTRYAWGAQDSPKAQYATKAVGGLKALPKYAESKELVDDFLGKKCARCHLNSPAPHRMGDYRATGCAACHMVYGNDGKTKTGDKAILSAANQTPAKIDVSGMHPSTKRGYPIVHKFTSAVPTMQCARCHSGNRSGTEYLGIAEHDYEQMYRSPREKGKSPATLYGIEQHHLKSDIHYEKGMACIDCHSQSEVMGDGKSYDQSHQAVKVRCQDCHGTPTSKPKTMAADAAAVKIAKSNPNYMVKAGDKIVATSGGTLLANVKEEGGKLVLTSKVTGKKHIVPLLADKKDQPANHQVSAHMNKMECHACHSRFVPQDWGLHLMREDYTGYAKWKRWREPDPQTMFLLYSFHGQGLGDEVSAPNDHILAIKADKPAVPETMNWLTGEKTTGVWYSAWTMRNWEDVALGYNSRGKISIFKPQFQYFVSHIGQDFMNAGKKVDEIKKKIAAAKTSAEAMALKAELLEAEKAVKAQILKDSETPKTKDGKIGLIMNPAAPHTTRTAVRTCEKCHQNGNAAGLGETQFMRAENKNVPLMESERSGLPINFQLNQMVTEKGDVLQTSTHIGARPFNAGEIKSLLSKSKAYNAFRYMDLEQNGYTALIDRKDKDLTGGVKRPVVSGTSLGDVREVGSYYDWKRGGFWQTDPAVFKDEYYTSPNPESMKYDLSKDPNTKKDEEEVKKASGTDITKANRNWVPKK